MPTTDAIERRLDTAGDLRSIVRTMKALAAVNIRQYEEAAVSIADYARTVELGFQALLRVRPGTLDVPAVRSSPPCIGAIVLGSDHGLCGAFNEQVAAFYFERRAADQRTEGERLMALGLRAAGRLEDLKQRPAVVLTLPASAVRIATLVREVLEHVAAWREAGAVDTVRVYFNAPHGQAGSQPREEQLLPLDGARLRALAARPWRPRATPALAGDWDSLFAAIVRQHLFVTVHRAITLSLASENASRLAAMHAAERSIDERLHSLRGQFNRERQASITTELLDIVSGYETLAARARPPVR
ncbi:MAG: F0F1 ATP synthase subunit gamma [Acidobacteria bacterium]|nr:F0F1 ATP synthase subunit gamma [Acidobacteriota bacterium]